MNVTQEDFRRHFELLSDEALVGTNRDDLVEGARQCYDEEVDRRELLSPAEVEAVSAQPTIESAPEGDELVSIGTFMSGEEASLARGLLEGSGIPAILANEHAGLGMFQLELKVPSSFVDRALEVLDEEISEEELAAQAEAAGEADAGHFRSEE